MRDRTDELLRALPGERPISPDVFASAVALLDEMAKTKDRVRSLIASASMALEDAQQDIELSKETTEVLSRRMQGLAGGQ